MSYLDVPRIHVMGLFYTAPGNLNNAVGNYDPNNPLNYNTGRYKYPDGTAQFWLEGCVVTSVVGLDGAPCSDPGLDALVGARVTSPSPEIPKPDGHGGLYALAKMADLDPSMQFRSELYGLRIYVDVEGGGGFSGEIALPPQLRDLWFGRGDGGMTGNQVAVGTWHQRMTNLAWTEPKDPSPVLEALRARSGAGLDVKMGVDMFQTARANQFTQGDRFGYGRLVAAIGPASADEPAQVVPGRRLYTPGTIPSQASMKSMLGAKIELTRQAAEEAVDANAPPPAWNRTDLRVCTLQDGRKLLIADRFNSAPLAPDRTGKFNTGSNVTVGWLDGGNRFTPLTEGRVSLAGYIQLDAQTRKLKDVWWPEHAAIVQIELADADVQAIKDAPLAIQAGGSTVVQENPNGVYLNSDRCTTRLEPNASGTFDVFVYQYGNPGARLPDGLTLQTAVYNEQNQSNDPATIFRASLDPSPKGPGRFQLLVETGPAVPLTPVRKPLDSFLCFLVASGAGYAVAEDIVGLPSAPLLSILFWQDHQVVEQPTWAANIGPLMQNYSRLYPGMKSILDISDPETFKAFAAPLRARFELDRNDPGCMPVTRDMSPATLRMMLQFLDSLMKEQLT